MTPDDLERLIDAHRVIVELDEQPELQRIACDRMAELISRRSPEKIHAMETERGLA